MPPVPSASHRFPRDEGLDRAIGPWGLGATAVNGAVGAGIFALPGIVAAILGPAAIIAYLLCGLAIALVLTCFIEIGSVVSRSGGAVAYVEEAFGPLAGFLAWVMYSVGFVIASDAAVANVLVDSLATTLPPLAHGAPRVLAMALLFGGLGAINIRGVRQGIRFSVTITAAKLLPLLFLIVGGLLVLHWRDLRWTGWPTSAEIGEASLILFLAFAGAEAALTPSGEIRDPAHTVPRGIFGATVCLILLYLALQVVTQGVLGSELARETAAPLVAVAQHIIGTSGRTLILVCTPISVLGAMFVGALAASRAVFLAAEEGMFPRALASVHPEFRTPHFAIVAVVVVEFVLAVTGGFRALAILGSASILCVYLLVCLGAWRLRATRQRAAGAFRAPGGPLVPLLGSITVLWLLAHSTLGELGVVAGTLSLAAGYYLLRRRVLR